MQDSPGCRGAQELLPGKERGTGSSKQPAKGSVTPTSSLSPPQAAGKRKPKKKKKKGDQDDSNSRSSRHGSSPSASEETDKHHSKSRKYQNLSAQLLEILSLGKDPGPAQDAAKGIHIDAERNKLLSSASAISGSIQTDQDLSDQINESLRWDGILEDPAAEEERLRIYKLKRRKRYGLYVQQQLPTEPCLTLKHFPLLQNKDLYTNSGQTICKEDGSSPYFQGNRDEAVLNAELATKVSELQPAALPNVSQEVV
ncbi:protein LIAT1 [Emydura macquarii macquarii]|uniref:protein LIAT1 n=1 Tax=Emydura macquarii macquarii TaxID=1129001 RepID=UPI00352AA7F1